MNPSSSQAPLEPTTADFDAELQALAREAAAGVITAAAAEPAAAEGRAPAALSPPSPERVPAPPVDLEPVLEELRRLGALETAHRQLFDSLHAELRQYRDGFLLESLHLPVIRDLISLLDDMESVRCQVGALLPGAGGAGARARGEVARALDRTHSNVENTIHFLREILQRMDVEEIREGEGTFHRAIHRQVGVVPVGDDGEDGRVASVVRCGFLWRSRTLRPAEVIVRRAGIPPAQP
jgi:hypothetical protein